MKVVLAPDSFKGNLSSLQVANAIEIGIKRVIPNARCIKIAIADGGEGTVRSIVDTTGGNLIRKTVTGPDGRSVRAYYGMLPDQQTAVIEMAAAAGLSLVSGKAKNPLKTTTYGVGELMLAAARRGAKKIILGIGGSASNDGGVGMAQALGIRFLDAKGVEISSPAGGGMLDKIAAIDMKGLDPAVRKADIIAACDIATPLYGKTGAAYVFGPQKGASPAMVKVLDLNLRHLGKLIRKELKKEVTKIKGAGAGGGLGAGLFAFTRAKMKSGIDIVVALTQLDQHIKNADLVITGEGRIDFQTAFGKAPAGIARVARRYRIPVVAIGGGIADDAHLIFKHGIDGLESACARDMDLAEAIRYSRAHLANAAERVIRLILTGKKLVMKKRKK